MKGVKGKHTRVRKVQRIGGGGRRDREITITKNTSSLPQATWYLTESDVPTPPLLSSPYLSALLSSLFLLVVSLSLSFPPLFPL